MPRGADAGIALLLGDRRDQLMPRVSGSWENLHQGTELRDARDVLVDARLANRPTENHDHQTLRKGQGRS